MITQFFINILSILNYRHKFSPPYHLYVNATVASFLIDSSIKAEPHALGKKRIGVFSLVKNIEKEDC